uniref:Uncharacterized protein n=1 Tax=Anguilla anguilla TaxID=7936 RepID=A0A0E9U0G9_ANGAN
MFSAGGSLECASIKQRTDSSRHLNQTTELSMLHHMYLPCLSWSGLLIECAEGSGGVRPCSHT